MTGLSVFSLQIKDILFRGPINKDCRFDSDAAVLPTSCHLVVIKWKPNISRITICVGVCVLIKRIWNYEDNEFWP